MRYVEVFVFIVGTTPQIVTETIYALNRKAPPISPDRIYILTTTTGKKILEKELIESGRLETFYKEFKIKKVMPEVLVMKDRYDNPLDDIKTGENNEDVGDFIINFLKPFTEDGSIRLHCSLAGGRKTMGFYLGSALMLLGRPQDRLYHVLVMPEFESHPGFYWKPKKNRVIETRLPDGTVKKLNTKDAVIQLAELPFVRLGEKFSLKRKGFKALVKEGQRELDIAHIQEELVVNLKARTVTIGDVSIKMEPMQIFVYTAFLRQKIDRCRYPRRKYCRDCTDCFEYIHTILDKDNIKKRAKDYERIYNRYKMEELLEKHKDGISEQVLRSYISKIKNIILTRMGYSEYSSTYTITGNNIYAQSRYGIRIEKGKIKIV